MSVESLKPKTTAVGEVMIELLVLLIYNLADTVSYNHFVVKKHDLMPNVHHFPLPFLFTNVLQTQDYTV